MIIGVHHRVKKEDYYGCDGIIFFFYDKFRDAEIVDKDAERLTVKISAFEDGFVKWLISQSQNLVTLIGPESTKNKLVEEARTIIRKYGGIS